MAKKKRRQFHCQRCGDACEIYKKGKKHRVLVCPRCGVLATNPLALAPLAMGAVRTLAGSAIAEKVLGKDEKAAAPSPSCRPRESYSTEERVRDALR